MRVNGGRTSIEQRELIDELRQRFPLLERLVGRFGTNAQAERIPWLFALLLSAARKGDTGTCCFVLDKTPGTTAVAAILLALVRLQEEFPEIVRNYAQTGLNRGQRVRVKPSNHVFEYSGIWEQYPDFFRLKVLDKEDSLSFHMSKVLRLEPTDRVLPKGDLGSDLGEFQRSALDELLDLTTCGNNSLIRNTVFLYMAQARFAEVMDAVALAPEHANKFNKLSGFLPWGSIGQDGKLKTNDAYQVAGEPIVAVTKVPEDLALASSSAAVATKVVLVDGARGLARDLQAFDDIADRQKVVILASFEETEALGLLRDRDCPIWYMSPNEILIGEASTGIRARESLVGATIRAADTRQRVKVNVVDCHDDLLQTVAKSLEHAAALIGDSEEGHESEEILARFFRILFECSECCFGVGEETRASLRSAQGQLTQYRKWLDPGVVGELQEASCRLEEIISSGAYGEGKANALLNLVLSEDPEPWVVVTRSPRTAETLRAGFDGMGANVPVIPISAITPDRDYAGIIVPAWPNEQRFTRLKAQAVAPDIRVLAYPFETKWVSRHQARERERERASQLEAEMRSSILGIEPRLLNSLKGREPESLVDEIRHDLPIFRIEDRIARRRIARPRVAVAGEAHREAQLVQFFGGCHALLTEWAELPRLNQLIDETDPNQAKLKTVTVARLSPGDFVLFRASGEKEFIRLIAEDIFGADEYERVRTAAERWKSSLRCLGTSPTDVQRRLAAHGLTRTTTAVRGWLNSPDRIGPGDFQDIEFIAKATRDAELLSIKKDVEEAISRIRSAHISAGSRLTQLLLGELDGRLNQLDEQPVLLDLDYGEAWVVQIEMIDERRQEYPSNLVNRLLWTDHEGF